jgi:hypothetical protein
MGTDWKERCSSSSAVKDWPPDLIRNNTINVSDVVEHVKFILPGFFYVLHDFNTDGIYDLIDTIHMKALWAQTCTAVPPLPCTDPPWWSYPPPWMLPAADADCDGFSTADETTIGTVGTEDCGYTPGGAPESDNWPADLVESNGVNISDVLSLKPVFGGSAARYDVVPSGSVNISDVLALKGFFGDSCPA